VGWSNIYGTVGMSKSEEKEEIVVMFRSKGITVDGERCW